MLALTSCTGKLGGATLDAILKHNLIPPSQLVMCTSSDTTSPKFSTYKSLGIQVRSFDFDSPSPSAFQGCTKLYLVSTPNIAMDFNNAPPGQGREKAHIEAIKAAISAGVKEIVYTSLAFGSESGAGVMQAHLRTEAFLKDLKAEGKIEYTIIREGLYNESWPLYLGYYDPKKDERGEIVLVGDGEISWTAISDLGLGTALVLADESGKWRGKTFYLSNSRESKSLKEIAGLVGQAKGKELGVKIVSREEYVQHYMQNGKEAPSVEWWSTTYGALEKGECEIEDDTLIELLKSKGVEPKPVEETVREMLS
ncbi:uncharacterized protein PAC_15080 [Phialocephala subalpina]|uniref:Uncharacterized protein n=1 Tax=Phialocephala subalpina TaxID=576137 RepID=A0A1L7XJF4_9HELO|nr:uncharacterized protein PAC_15080 [Phialocephala subalpina]